MYARHFDTRKTKLGKTYCWSRVIFIPFSLSSIVIFRLTSAESSADTPRISNVVRSQKMYRLESWFFFFFFFKTSFHRFWWKNNGEKRERKYPIGWQNDYRRTNFWRFRGSMAVRSVVSQKIALSGYPVIRFCSREKTRRTIEPRKS